MKNNVVGLAVGIVCAIIMIGTVLVPIIEDSTQTEETFTNSGLYYVTDTDETITYSYLGGANWKVNGETLPYAVSNASNIIVANDIFVRNIGQVRGDVYQSWTSAELTVSNGTVTGTAYNGDTEYTIEWDCSERFYGAFVDEANYIMTDPDGTTYVMGDDEIFGVGMSSIASGTLGIFYIEVSGDTATVTCPNSSVTISDVEVNRTAVDGYEDLYIFESVTFHTEYSESEYDQTYNRVVAPSSVTAELSQHLSESEIILLSIVPLLVILAVLATITVVVMRDHNY